MKDLRRGVLAVISLAIGVLPMMIACPGGDVSRNPALPLPSEIDGWTPAEADARYDSETLYEYIDGGAEVYRSLGVREVLARRYSKEGAPDIIVDLFTMGTAADAYGAFHHDVRPGASAGVGNESELGDGSLAFWKGVHFVSIISPEDDGRAGATIGEIARSIAAAITDPGEPPELLRYLPELDGPPAETHAFHDERLLDRYYFIGPGNILGLGSGTDCLLARYSGRSIVLLVRYPDKDEAAEALARVAAETDPAGAGGDSGRRLPSGARAIDSLLAVVFESRSPVETGEMLAGIERLASDG